MYSETTDTKVQQTKTIFPYQFRPRLIPTLATLICLPIFISLGLWQLHRAEEKAMIQAELTARTTMPAIKLDNLHGNINDYRYRKISVQGHFDTKHQFLIDNKFHNHQLGYQVITPLIIAKQNKVLLINRGWLPADRDRRILPTLKQHTGLQNITGMISIPGKSFTLAKSGMDVTMNKQWPHRIQTLDLPLIERMLAKPVYPFVVLLAPKAKHGFVRQWQFINSKPEKHIGYAVQWFAFATILFILFVVLNCKRVRSAESSKAES